MKQSRQKGGEYFDFFKMHTYIAADSIFYIKLSLPASIEMARWRDTREDP